MAQRKSSGPSFYQSFVEYLEESAIGGLNKLGRDAANMAKKFLRDPGPDGYDRIDNSVLHDSITYGLIGSRTNRLVRDAGNPGNPNMGLVGGAASPDVIISPVKERFVCHVGTADPKAKYVEWDTSPHQTPRDSAQFIANMIDWGQRHNLSKDFINHLIRKIRRTGTSAHPFMRPTKDWIDKNGLKYFNASMSTIIKRIPKVARILGQKGVKIEGAIGVNVSGSWE